MIETWTFEINGPQRMHCEGCENALQRSLARLPGIRRLTADYHIQRVIVQVDPAHTDVNAVQAKFAVSGYEAKQI
jgi:copper chaperone